MKYSLAVLKSEKGPIPAVELDCRYYTLDELLPDLTLDPKRGLMDLLAIWAEQEDRLQLAVDSGLYGSFTPLGDPGAQGFDSPLSFPGKVICTGTNYRDHLRDDLGVTDFDKTGSDILYFQKHQKAVVGSGDVRYDLPWV